MEKLEKTEISTSTAFDPAAMHGRPLVPPDETRLIGETVEQVATLSDADLVFVETYVRTGDAVTAMVRAGIKNPLYNGEVVAEMTLERPEIAAAVELIRKTTKKGPPVALTRDSLSAMSQRVYDAAMATGDNAGAVAALKLTASLQGYLIERKEIVHRRNAADLTDEELMAFLDDRRPKDVTPAVKQIEGEKA